MKTRKVKKVRLLPGVRKKHAVRKRKLSGGPGIDKAFSKVTLKNSHK
jgi:hypothetical protein